MTLASLPSSMARLASVHVVGDVDAVLGVGAGDRAGPTRRRVTERGELFPALLVEVVLQGLRRAFADSLDETIQLDGEADGGGALGRIEVCLRAGVCGQIVKFGLWCAHVELAATAEGNEGAPAERAFGVVAGGKRRTVFRVRISDQREE